MELNCIRCQTPTAIHCSTDQCVWTVCLPCGLIYGPTGCIPTWAKYAEQWGINK